MPTDAYLNAKLGAAKKTLAGANAFEASVLGHSGTPHHSVPVPAPASPSLKQTLDADSAGVAESLKYNRDNVNEYNAAQKPQ